MSARSAHMQLYRRTRTFRAARLRRLRSVLAVAAGFGLALFLLMLWSISA